MLATRESAGNVENGVCPPIPLPGSGEGGRTSCRFGSFAVGRLVSAKSRGGRATRRIGRVLGAPDSREVSQETGDGASPVHGPCPHPIS